MDTIKLFTGVTGYPDTDVAKSNVIPIRSSTAEVLVKPKPNETSGDHFISSSRGIEAADRVPDTVTLTSLADTNSSTNTRRAARVAGVIAAVQNGTYQIDSEAVVNAALRNATEASTA